MRRSVLTVLALVGLCLAVPASVAQADSTRDVGLTGFADMVVDQTHGHLFISQGSGTVVVTGLTGRPVGTLTGLAGAHGMTLSDDGSALFVALTGANAIAEVDTTQPLAAGAVTSFPTGADSCPMDVAFTAGLVWYDATCNPQATGLRALDPATGTTHDLGIQIPFQTQLVAGPSLPNTLIVHDFGPSLTEYTATGGDSPALTPKTHGPINAASQFALSSDGSQIVTGAQESFATSDLSHVLQDFSVPRARSAVAVRSSDDLIAFGRRDGVVLYRHGATSSAGTYRFDDRDADVVAGGLAFGASTLYAVTFDTRLGANYALQVITPHNRPLAKVSIAVSGGHHRFGKKATLTATLHSSTTRRKLTLLAVTTDGRVHLVKTGKVDRRGRLQVRPVMTETAKFAAVFDGDATHAASVALTPKVKVAALVLAKLFKATGHSGRYALYPASKKALLGAAVGPNHRGDCLFFRAQIQLRGHWGQDVTTGCVHLNRRSAAGARLDGDPALVGIPLRMRAEWKGDARNTKSKSPWRYLKFVSSRAAAPRSLVTEVVSPRLSAWRR